MKTYNALIVDDEENNLLLLRHFITKFCQNIKIIAEANSIETAIENINKTKPQILFLDIQLSEDTVFTVFDHIDLSEVEIIFVTAYDEYALKAFKYNAVDYILKPLTIEDLILAVNKAVKRIEERIYFEKKIDNFEKNYKEQQSKYLSISSLDKVDIIKKSDILFCKSDGRYTTFYLNDKSEVVACKNLGEFENLLIEDSFFRIHHSYIVNLDFIININKKGGYYCDMTNGARLPVAKRRQESLNRFLKIKE